MFEITEPVIVLFNGKINLATYVTKSELGSHIVKLESGMVTSILEFNIWDINCFNIPDVFRNEAIKVLANFRG